MAAWSVGGEGPLQSPAGVKKLSVSQGLRQVWVGFGKCHRKTQASHAWQGSWDFLPRAAASWSV